MNRNRNETDDNYTGVVALLNDKWRVIRCKNGIQWVLQRRSLNSDTGRYSRWEARSYCRTKSGLLACINRYINGSEDLVCHPAIMELPRMIEENAT